jgi:hypothetical protein
MNIEDLEALSRNEWGRVLGCRPREPRRAEKPLQLETSSVWLADDLLPETEQPSSTQRAQSGRNRVDRD